VIVLAFFYKVQLQKVSTQERLKTPSKRPLQQGKKLPGLKAAMCSNTHLIFV
jgi:hypothetical protein